MKDIIQLKNPRSQKYIKINRKTGKIIGSKKTPYKNIPIICKHKNHGINKEKSQRIEY